MQLKVKVINFASSAVSFLTEFYFVSGVNREYHEMFRLFPDDSSPHLYGLTFYGENIQDEWYIVEIICHLTKIYPHVIGRIFDADGEFLLIEAAEVLPKWADPDTCAQKVCENCQVHS